MPWTTGEEMFYACGDCGRWTALPEHPDSHPETVRYACSRCGLCEHTAAAPVEYGSREYRCLSCDEHRVVDNADHPGVYVQRVCARCGRQRRHVRVNSAADVVDLLAREPRPSEPEVRAP